MEMPAAAQRPARRYLDILAGAFMVRVLPPWLDNLRKRQVKEPKVYVRGTGLLHTLPGISGESRLLGHPKVGASFEGFVVEQVLGALETRDACYRATHAGAELDLLVLRAGERYGFECRFADAPGTTRTMRAALEDLGLDHLWIVYPGDEAYVLVERITVLPVAEIRTVAESMTPRRPQS